MNVDIATLAFLQGYIDKQAEPAPQQQQQAPAQGQAQQGAQSQGNVTSMGTKPGPTAKAIENAEQAALSAQAAEIRTQAKELMAQAAQLEAQAVATENPKDPDAARLAGGPASAPAGAPPPQAMV